MIKYLNQTVGRRCIGHTVPNIRVAGNVGGNRIPGSTAIVTVVDIIQTTDTGSIGPGDGGRCHGCNRFSSVWSSNRNGIVGLNGEHRIGSIIHRNIIGRINPEQTLVAADAIRNRPAIRLCTGYLVMIIGSNGIPGSAIVRRILQISIGNYVRRIGKGILNIENITTE